MPEAVDSEARRRIDGIEGQLNGVQKMLRDHDLLFARLSEQQAVTGQVLAGLRDSFGAIARDVEALNSRITLDEKETAAYRQAQSFSKGKLAGIGLTTLSLLGLFGALVVDWFRSHFLG